MKKHLAMPYSFVGLHYSININKILSEKSKVQIFIIIETKVDCYLYNQEKKLKIHIRLLKYGKEEEHFIDLYIFFIKKIY